MNVEGTHLVCDGVTRIGLGCANLKSDRLAPHCHGWTKRVIAYLYPSTVRRLGTLRPSQVSYSYRKTLANQNP